MKDKEKRIILILAIVLIVIVSIVIILKKRSQKEKYIDNEETQSVKYEEFVSIQEDGTKVNTSEKLKDPKEMGKRYY